MTREQRLEAELGNATRQHEACATKLWDAEQKVTQLEELLRLARDAFQDISEYWNGSDNERAISDAVAHFSNISSESVKEIDAALAKPAQPAQITASNGAELVNIQRPTAFAAPSEGALMAQTPLETAQEWADWIPYPDSPAAEWDRFNLANGFLLLRERVGSLEACLSIQEDAERQASSPAGEDK